MKQKRKVAIILVVLTVVAILVAGFIYDRERRKERTYLDIEQVYTINVENLDANQKENFGCHVYYTSKARLKNCGVDISNLELNKNEELFYSRERQVEKVWYNNYKPVRAWKSNYTPGPILLDVEFGEEDDKYIYIYKIKLPEGDSFDISIG